MRTLKKSLIAIAAVYLLVDPSLYAERTQPHWDDGYRIFQDHAPNFVHVEILNVTSDSNKALWFASASDRVEIEARVLKVIRTKNGLRPGMIIPIIYNRKAAAGGTFAETPGIPDKGAILPAFIKIKGDYFVPAARHHTFTPLAEEQLQKLDRDAVELSEAQIAALRLPAELENAYQLNTTAELPLEAPAIAEVNPQTPEFTVDTELPMIDEETPGLITPTIPDAPASSVPEIETSATASTEAAIPALKAEVVTTPEVPAVTTEVAMDSSQQPVIDTGSTSDAAIKPKTKRRTVVVVPPSELRTRRQQEIQTIVTQPSQPTSLPAPAAPSYPALKAEVVTPDAPLVPEAGLVVIEPEPAVLTPESDVTPPATEIAPLRAEPVQTTTSHAQVEAMDPNPQTQVDDILARAEQQQASVEPVTSPSEPDMPQEEPVTITDFTPKTPAPATTPVPQPSAISLTESDRANMKSYADIYLSLQKADTAASEKDFDSAKSLYQNALQGLETLKSNYPEFQPFMVEYRIRDTGRKLEQLVLQASKEPSP